MGLLNHFNDTNKVITTGKSISYSSEIEHGSWSYRPTINTIQTYGHDYKITRSCRYSYMYVGMDYQTAKNCATYFMEKFTRQTKISKWNPDLGIFVTESSGETLMADIKVQLIDGNMYECLIDISETDTRMSIEEVSNLSSLFTIENARQYDYIGN